ncbi:hypothetical protein [Accumulibacter sp.]|uniref:hypothetical protein n=1 Tax=Accumulibacter sp. TaxID=2053492 RepID=UPI0025FFFBA8|nr:hypothetical protein [Accumulibacter sp.]MCM8613143.1 hypothetical protein [Accumulibacter sp.]MCM8636570.1 hypothetical protein [Accumulibacter sp.]MCM8640196.1 hypothetical protein [Accumulibacter sp.]
MKYPRWIRLKGASDSALLKAVGKSIQQQRTAACVQCANKRGSGVLAQVQGNPTDQPGIVVDALLSQRLRGFME